MKSGDVSPIDNPELFPVAKYIIPVTAENDGYITKINTEAMGLIAMELGAGRATKDSIIDLTVGIVLNKKRGDKVNKGDVIAYIHSNKEDNNKIEEKIKENIKIEAEFNDNIPLIYNVIS